MKEYKIRASSMSASYNAGRYTAESPAEACEMARQHYADSALGRALRDVGAFRFYTVDKFDFERDEEETEEV